MLYMCMAVHITQTVCEVMTTMCNPCPTANAVGDGYMQSATFNNTSQRHNASTDNGEHTPDRHDTRRTMHGRRSCLVFSIRSDQQRAAATSCRSSAVYHHVNDTVWSSISHTDTYEYPQVHVAGVADDRSAEIMTQYHARTSGGCMGTLSAPAIMATLGHVAM